MDSSSGAGRPRGRATALRLRDLFGASLLLCVIAACGGTTEDDPQAEATTATVTPSAVPLQGATPGSSPSSSSSSAPPGQDPPPVEGREMTGPDAAAEADIDAAGAVAGLSFRDRNGVNVIVLRELDGTRVLADHISLIPMAERRDVLREVRDGVPDCTDGDPTAEFVRGSLEVRDDDDDGVGEVVYAYRIACRTDPGQSELKLLLVEGSEKHILRGLSTNSVEPAPSEPEPEPAPPAWPSGSYDFATQRFDEVQPEF